MAAINHNYYTFALIGIDATSNITLTSQNWDLAVISGFSHVAFWQAFARNNNPTTSAELIELILDITRYHFCPKVAGLPGVTITVGEAGPFADYNVVLQKGRTKCQPFNRGKGAVYSYTGACLATAGIFEAAFHSNAAGLVACNTINGNYNGYTQYCNTLDGWTQADQTNSENNFAAWVALVGTNVRDPAVDTKIKAAAAQAIVTRLAAGGVSAFSMRNILKQLTNVNLIADKVTKHGSASNSAT